MFDNLDFKILDNREYKEDSVREDIVMPILKRLGYSSTGLNKIRRGISLTHPFVNIGSTQRKISIIPDYILETENGVSWILDAKSPSENIEKSSNVEQAYSYAINPEIRSEIYSLCNGRKLTVFHISGTEPLLDINIDDIDENWQLVEKLLSPIHLEKPFLKFFLPDIGVHLINVGSDPTMILHFVPAYVQSVQKINNDLYTLFSSVDFGEEYVASLDFTNEQFEEFINAVPYGHRAEILKRLNSTPFSIFYNSIEEMFPIILEAEQTQKIYDNGNEKYSPLQILSFRKFA